MRSALGTLVVVVSVAGIARAQPPEAPVTGAPAAPAAPDGYIVREGYRVEVMIERLPGARFLEFDDRGTLYVSRPGQGDIVAFRQEEPGGPWKRLGTFITGKRQVHGMHFRDGWLWFTTSGAVFKGRDADGDGVGEDVTEVLGGLPSGGHWWRSILVTGDGFYTSIGDSGNITDQTTTDRQKIWKYSLDGKDRSLFCSGIRNTEKLLLRPGTHEVWGLDHGSDWFGKEVGDAQGNQPITDLNPPDEFNHYIQGGFYGHPFVVGDRLPRYEYLKREDIHDLAADTIPPAWSVGAHWATNGFCFIDPGLNQRTGAFPRDHEGDAFIACHGSWNSSEPVGYCVARIVFDKDPALGGGPAGLLKIVSTVSGGRIRGRPVDCTQAPDGSVLFSTDQPGRVYRLTREAGPHRRQTPRHARDGMGRCGSKLSRTRKPPATPA
ncbi:MAG: hypothetical protein WD749_03540 [Phycisphaerales bacterium]